MSKHKWKQGNWQRDIVMNGPDNIYRIDVCERGCGYERRVVLTDSEYPAEWVESYSNENTAQSTAPACVILEYKAWTIREVTVLKMNYYEMSMDELRSLLPGRSDQSIYNKALCLGMRGKYKLSR